MSALPAHDFSSWISHRDVRTALPPVLGFGAAVGILFTGGVGWRRSRQWWDGLDGGSRALLAASVVVGLFLLITMVMLLLPSLTRVYEGQWGRQWVGRTLSDVAIRRQLERMKRLKAKDDDFAYARRYFSFPPSEKDVRPTRLGN